LALAAVLCTPAVAKPSPNNVRRSAPSRPAAWPPQSARQNTARPPSTARQNTARPASARQNAPRQTAASRPNTASRTNTARPNAGQSKTAQSKAAPSNTAPTNNAKPNAASPKTAQTNTAKSNTAHPTTATKGGQTAAAPGGGGAKNASNNPLHGGRQIPASRFNASFGRGHDFHIGHPIMIGGQASFQFGGFWFGIVDPWPAAWLYTDAVYVDFIGGGYVLVDVAHPGLQVAVSVGDTVSTCTASAAAVSSTSLARKISEPAGGDISVDISVDFAVE